MVLVITNLAYIDKWSMQTSVETVLASWFLVSLFKLEDIFLIVEANFNMNNFGHKFNVKYKITT